MQKRIVKIIVVSFLIYIIVISVFITRGFAATDEFEPEHGFAPEVDGKISKAEKEWQNATKTTIKLYSNSTQTDEGLTVKLWVMLNESNLYLSIQFELEPSARKETEFIGFLISKSDSEANKSFIDARIVQFSNVLKGKFEYKDLNIDNNVFYEDSHKDGDGAAILTDDEIIYEFDIPVNNTQYDEKKQPDDVFLDFGEEYAFKIIYGERDIYPSGINKSNTVLINIEYPPAPEPRNPWINTHNIILIIVFIFATGLSGYYIFKIIKLKKKVERVSK